MSSAGPKDRARPKDSARLKDMAWVPGGKFLMGSEDFYPEERPARHVEVDGFWMDDHQVTVAEFRRFVTAAARFPGDAVVLGLTGHVDDDNPLWATLDASDGRVVSLGGESGSQQNQNRRRRGQRIVSLDSVEE